MIFVGLPFISGVVKFCCSIFGLVILIENSSSVFYSNIFISFNFLIEAFCLVFLLVVVVSEVVRVLGSVVGLGLVVAVMVVSEKVESGNVVKCFVRIEVFDFIVELVINIVSCSTVGNFVVIWTEFFFSIVDVGSVVAIDAVNFVSSLVVCFTFVSAVIILSVVDSSVVVGRTVVVIFSVVVGSMVVVGSAVVGDTIQRDFIKFCKWN